MGQGPGTTDGDQGPGPRTMGHGPRTMDRDQGPGTMGPGPGTTYRYQGPSQARDQASTKESLFGGSGTHNILTARNRQPYASTGVCY